MQHNDAILAFQHKRGDSSITFLVPFLDKTMDVLDIGCGPGTITAALKRFTRTAIGIDINPRAVATAGRMHAGVDRLSFVTSTMTKLPFPDAHFDAVLFHAVLYHLNPETLSAALAEARRVLKPGGLIATRDADIGGNILHPESDGLRLALDLWMRWYEHADPDAGRFGRRQSAVLRSHHFEPVWTGASFVNHSADAATRREAVADARRSLAGMEDELIARGLASHDDIAHAMQAWNDWGNDPDSIYLRCRCECVARRP
jgi:ubiquinone/menaquinone biosynthesis C-methylase UbiE